MEYNLYFYNAKRNVVVMTDMDGKQHVIDCDKAEVQVVLEEMEDVGYLVRLAREEPASCNASRRIAGLCGCVE